MTKKKLSQKSDIDTYLQNYLFREVKMKKVSLLLVLFIILFGLLGCTRGSGIVTKSKEYNTLTKMSMSYEKFTGYKQTEIKVDEGETVDVFVDIVTDDGTINAYISKDNEKDNCDYEGQDIQTSSFTVTLSEPGTYAIRVDADDHKGSYSFSWE